MTTTTAGGSTTLIGSIIAFVICLGCAVVAGLIASNKDRNVWGWAILSFFLPVLGLLIVAILPTKVPFHQPE